MKENIFKTLVLHMIVIINYHVILQPLARMLNAEVTPPVRLKKKRLSVYAMTDGLTIQPTLRLDVSVIILETFLNRLPH